MILDGFWKDFGWILEGFWMDFGWVLNGCLRILEGCLMDFDRFGWILDEF